MLGYTTRHISAHTRKDIELLIYGTSALATTDLCLLANHSREILLLVQEDKIYLESKKKDDAEAQFIASAIASFQNYNKRRIQSGLTPHKQSLFPRVVMTGTTPAFYKILATEALSNAVMLGVYHPTPTVVFSHVPAVPRLGEGMKPLDNRRAILRCFEAFGRFIIVSQ